MSFTILIVLAGAICLSVGASRQGWRLIALALVLATFLPFVGTHATLVLHALAPIIDTVLVGTLVLVAVSVFRHRKPRDPSDKRRVERD